MRFGVLGPLAVWGPDGRQVRVPEVKVRALLAGLLIEPGRVVPADRLIDALWLGSLPANPAGALQTRVSQLRRVLGKDAVVARPPGYLLQVPPSEVDAVRFQELLTRAGASTGRARVDLLADALALWRGPALIEFADDEFARAEIARLEELRLTALEEQAEARLEIGEHAMLADELGDLVARHPLRERLRAAQLKALYRAGRQGEALDGYRLLREHLDDELGLEPGPELAALHQAILRQDPSLAAPRRQTRRTNLPAALTDLIGRDAAVSEVAGLLDAARLVTLTGPGGVGKTSLALETARRLADSYPDGVWLVELASTPAESVAEVVAAALDVRDEGSALADHLSDALRGQRVLLVLDNCEQVAGAVGRLTAHLLRAAPGLRVLATSQEPLGIGGEQLWNVPPLPSADAVRLFTARAAASAPGVALDPEAVSAICARLDGLPLALELAATRVRALGVRELAARLDDRFRVLGSGRSDAPARQRTLRAMIDWSWELLGPEEQTVLRRLAVHADGCTLAAAEAVCGGDDVLGLLARLVDRSLVVVGEGPRYRLLESVAAYCQERLEEAGEREEIRDRHRAYYLALAERAAPQLLGPEQRQWTVLLDAESANFRAALDGGDERLANALAWYWVLRGRLGEGRRWLASAVERGGTSATTQTWLDAFMLRTGEAHGCPPPEDGPGDDMELARATAFLAFAMVGIGDPAAGEEVAERALTAFRRAGEPWGIAFVRSVRARQAQVRGDLDAARTYAEQSRSAFAELGDRWGQVQVSFPLGQHAEIDGDYERAARIHRESLRMAEELELWTEVADRLSLLGRIAQLTGQQEQADDLHRRAMALAAEHGYTVGEEFAALGLALGARRQGRLEEAEELLRTWLAWDRALDSDPAIALILAELGFVAELRGDAEGALALHEEGMATARRTGDPRAVALALEGMAGALALGGEAERARELLAEAEALRESTGAPLPPAERGDVDRIRAALARQ
ncbi:BTAD domain-containing putative transcriptional regulator [Nonomuraea longicatena]|uniref:BTAD domain-containing putative transcriptional regulator n=1 Tax=Nonomuraea longicatena TaxID=83682 RepID=A0ABN1PVH6_9ACTN